MIFLLAALSLGISILGHNLWRRRLAAMVSRSGQAEDLADVTPAAEWVGIVSLLLPRGPRRGWNLLLVWGCTLLLGGLPHGLVLAAISRGEEGNLALFYVLTLGWWLGALGLPALVLTRHRLAAARNSMSS